MSIFKTKKSKASSKGSFIVFFAVGLVALLAVVALVIDGARLMISVTKSKQLSEQAATLAIREYITFMPHDYEHLPDEVIHSEKMKRVKKTVSTLLNDDLNELFGNKDGVRVVVSGEDIVEGLTLEPGEYFSHGDDITSDTALKNECKAQEAITKRQGCWVPFIVGTGGRRYNTGVNSFYAVVTTPSQSLIQSLFARVVNSQSFGITNDAYSYLRPRVFYLGVDMSKSITEGTFNSTGKFRGNFISRVTEGGGSGESCINTLGSSSPACDFRYFATDGTVLNPQDDIIWNAEYYSNDPRIHDHRCSVDADSICGFQVDSKSCQQRLADFPYKAKQSGFGDTLTDPAYASWCNYRDDGWNHPNPDLRGRYGHHPNIEECIDQRLISDNNYQWPNIWRPPSYLDSVPLCSPVFWSKNPMRPECHLYGQSRNCCNPDCIGGGSCAIQTLGDPHSCFVNIGFDYYGFRFLGDRRYDNGGLFLVPLSWDPSNLVARQPHFKRYKDDYKGVHLDNLTRAKIDTDGSIVDRPDGANLSGDYLYENPWGLRNQLYSNGNAGGFETGLDRNSQGEGLTSFDKPEGYFMFDDRKYGVGNGDFGGNAYLTYPAGSIWYRGRGYFLPRRQPHYEGPEPYTSILKGIWSVHDIVAKQNVPGDRIGVMFFDASLTATKSQVPLSKVIPGETKTANVTTDQQKLKDLLNAIDPRDYEYTTEAMANEKTLQRLRLGLFPDPNAPDTNISNAISNAYNYLKKIPNFKGTDVYFGLLTDFVAFAHCHLKPTGGGLVLTQADIDRCAAGGKPGTKNGDTTWHEDWTGAYDTPPYNFPKITDEGYANLFGLHAGDPDPQYGTSWEPFRQLVGMLNDLIGWPTSTALGGEPDDIGYYTSGSHSFYNRNQGLLGFLKQEGITPILFAFNGTLGGELIYPKTTAGQGCMSRSEAREATDVNDHPLPLVRTRQAYWWHGQALVQINQYRVGGQNGMFYNYFLGDLANPVAMAGGKLIQLLSPCPNATQTQIEESFPAHVPGAKTAKERLDALCNKSRNPNTTEDHPIPLDLYTRDSSGSFFSNPWTGDASWRSWAAWRKDNGWTPILWLGQLVGANITNPFYDYGAQMDANGWYGVKDDGGGRTPMALGWSFPILGKVYAPHITNLNIEPFPIHVSDMGGLRCETRTQDVNGSIVPYGIDKQIKETFEDIVQHPKALVVSEPNRLSNSR